MPLRFHCACGDDQTYLYVSTHALDRAFAASDPEAYAAVSEAKVDLLAELDRSADNEVLRAPIIAVGEDGRLWFENGRHRARAALQLGRKSIPVIVYENNVTAVRELLARFC